MAMLQRFNVPVLVDPLFEEICAEAERNEIFAAQLKNMNDNDIAFRCDFIKGKVVMNFTDIAIETFYRAKGLR